MSNRRPDVTKSGAVPRRRRSPGFTNRPHRQQMEKDVIRARLEATNPELSGDALTERIESEYKKLIPHDPQVLRQFEATAQISVCPSRRKIFEKVEVKAIRRLALTKRLEEELRVASYGRPSDRRLVAGAFLRTIFENGRPDLISHYKAFQEANEPLHWAYDWPARDGSNRDPSSVYRTLHSTLLRCSPAICLELNVAGIVALRNELGVADIGRFLVIDGTHIVAPREQRQHDPAYPVEERHLRRGLRGADYATHAHRKSWRGYRLIIIHDVKLGLALGFALAPASRPEYEVLQPLLLDIHRHWNHYSGETWEPEYLIGDAHFDIEAVHRLCEERFAIHPVIDRNGSLSRDIPWADNDGTPYCSAVDPATGQIHGDMKLVQAQYFPGHRQRREHGLAPGDPADLSQAAFRWKCTYPGCPSHYTTRWNRHPRAYNYLPHRGHHRSRVALRTALMLRRNVSESVNARLKGRGTGNGGMNVPLWVSTDGEMEWLTFGTCMALTLQRLAHVTGEYDRAEAEAAARGLLRPCQPSDIQIAARDSRR